MRACVALRWFAFSPIVHDDDELPPRSQSLLTLPALAGTLIAAVVPRVRLSWNTHGCTFILTTTAICPRHVGPIYPRLGRLPQTIPDGATLHGVLRLARRCSRFSVVTRKSTADAQTRTFGFGDFTVNRLAVECLGQWEWLGERSDRVRPAVEIRVVSICIPTVMLAALKAP